MKLQGIFFTDFSQSYIPEILKELYRDRIYDPFLVGKKDLVVFDIGANIGLFSQFIAPYAKQIFAVEPSKQHIETIQHMIQFNGLTQVIPLQLAVSHKAGMAEFYHNDNQTMFSLKKEVNTRPQDVELVPTVTLDGLLKDVEHVDFMKIDIEGAEAEVFGSEGFEKCADKIDIIVGEFHQWSGVNPKLFESYFTDRGFLFNWLNKTEASVFSAERIK